MGPGADFTLLCGSAVLSKVTVGVQRNMLMIWGGSMTGLLTCGAGLYFDGGVAVERSDGYDIKVLDAPVQIFNTVAGLGEF